MLTVTLDWLSVTYKDFYDDNGERKSKAKDFVDRYCSAATVVPASARNGYSTATTDQNGVQVMWNDDRPEMGLHAVFSGSALRNIFECNGISSTEILAEVSHSRGSITRLDLAKDLVDEAIDLAAIYQSLEKNGNKGTARNWAEMRSSGDGYTLYVGARTSEKFIRIYNKAAESHLSGQLWARYEIETKGLVSRAVASSLVSSANWGGVFDTIADAMVPFAVCKALSQFQENGKTRVGIPKLERITDREKWISEQVISAVAKHYIDHPESEGVARLRSTLDLIEAQKLAPYVKKR